MNWTQLKPRERTAVIALGGCALLAIYMNAIHKPTARRVAGYQSQIRKAESQLKDLTTKTPQDEEVAEKIVNLEEQTAGLAGQLGEFEKKVPSAQEVSQLVGEFTRLAKEVKLESVKQKIVKEQSYARIFFEVKFYSSYKDAVTYIAALETVSPFLRVEEMEIQEPAGKTAELGGAPVRLVMSCLLGETSGAKIRASQTPEIELKRDILSSEFKPASLADDSKYVLEGITYHATNPTAIINGDVYQLNSKIDGLKVKKILEDTVLLTDGIQDKILSLKTVTVEADQ